MENASQKKPMYLKEAHR